MNVRDISGRAALATVPPSRPIGKGPAALLAGAAALGAAALWNTARARRAEREHPPSGRFLEVGGVRLHYLERGAGPPVVLLHGNVVSAEDFVWSGVLDRVAKRHRAVAIDRPGFGHSTRPHGSVWSPAAQASLLRSAFAQLGLERPVVVGHSWGTLVAPPAIPVLGDVMRYTVSPLLGRALLPANLKGMFAPLPLPGRFRRAFPYGFPVRPSQVRAEAQDAVTMVPAVAAMRQRYQDLRHLPVTIMAGVEDRVVGVDGHARWFHDALPHSELRLVPGTGHMFHHAVPDQVADVIAAVMGTQPTIGYEDRPAA